MSSRSQFWYGKSDYSILSDRSAGSSSSRYITPKEMVHEINERVRNHLAPPDYVRRLDELPPNLLSWNNKIPVSKSSNETPSRHKVAVNIIGCHQPIELLIAKADKRQRHERRVRQQKSTRQEIKEKELNEAITTKLSRAERFAAELEYRQRQLNWLKVITITQYLERIKTFHKKKNGIIVGDRFKDVAHFASKIRKNVLKWYYRRIFKKYKLGFLKALKSAEFYFRLNFRIWRKRRATKRLLFCLNQSGIRKKIYRDNIVVVHTFLTAVRKIQRSIRLVITRKKAIVTALMKLWNRLEIAFITKMLKKRAAKKIGSAVTESKVNFDFVDNKTKIEMKNQARRWSEINSQMEGYLEQLKHRRIIKKETEEEAISNLMLADNIRVAKLKNYVHTVRREYYINQTEILRKQLHMMTKATFHESDASDLLKGRNIDRINSLMNERGDTRASQIKFQPLNFFKSIDHSAIRNLVEESHREAETFAIKTDLSHHGRGRPRKN
eukprot:gene30295-40266_t